MNDDRQYERNNLDRLRDLYNEIVRDFDDVVMFAPAIKVLINIIIWISETELFGWMVIGAFLYYFFGW